MPKGIPGRAMCLAPDCGRLSHTAGLCNMHHKRWQRHGSYERQTPEHAQPERMHASGYVLKHDPDHPLANKRFYGYKHRFVLFDAIGYGPHRCHWCRKPINWHAGLEADHVDGDKLNNLRANIVESCGGCNIRRSIATRRDPVTGRLLSRAA